MKFFTREWANGDLPDERFADVRAKYWQHINSLLPNLPESVTQLAKQINLHDSLVRRVVLNRGTRNLALELRCGDLQTGYFDLDLIYSGVVLETLDFTTLVKRARDRQTELLYHEVDLNEDGNYAHRILFWPEGEISIIFSALQINQVKRLNRSIPYIEDPYLEISS
jgi:hypothetical protein